MSMGIKSVNFTEEDVADIGLKPIRMLNLDNIVVLAGQNGSGKTRLLTLIKQLFAQVPTAKFLNEVDTEIAKKLESIKNYKHSIQENTKQLQIDNANNDQKLILKDNIRIYGTNLENEEKVIEDLELKKIYEKIIPYNHQDEYKFISLDFLSNTPKKHTELNTGEFTKYVESLKNNNIETEKFHAQVLSVIFELESRAVRIFADQHDIDIFTNINKQIELLLGEKVDSTGGKPKLFGKTLDEVKLSQGQRILLQMAVCLGYENFDISKTIVFLDEPENHLHPKALIEVFEKIKSAVPDGQIWVSTHSVHLLSRVNTKQIWYMEDGQISRFEKVSEKVLSGLVGNEDNIQQMRDFMMLPRELGMIHFTHECLFDPETVFTGKDDPQIKQMIGILKSEKKVRILDFGSGKGRLLAALYEVNINFHDKLDYYAYDISENQECKDQIFNVFTESNRYIIGQDAINDDLSNTFDFIIMCNVFHEIDPRYWLEIFAENGIVQKILKDNGQLIIVEDHKIPTGEKAYDNGFLLFDHIQFKSLFMIQDGSCCSEVDHDEDKYQGRLKAHIFAKNAVIATKDSIYQSIQVHKEISMEKLRQIRTVNSLETNYRHGRLHALYSQQLINAELALSDIC